MDLSLELEKAKLKIQAAFERLAKEGQISEADLNLIYELVDEMENMSETEFNTKLSDLKEKFGVTDF